MAKKASQKPCCLGTWITKNFLFIFFLILLLVAAVGLFYYQKTTKSNGSNTSFSSSTSTMHTETEKENQTTIRQENEQQIKNTTTNQVKTIVTSGDNITVDYIGKYAKDGKIFDTSIASVAKEAGIYQEGRNYEEGLTFIAGAGQMIKGFDRGVIGMKKGETKTIKIQAKDGYGERDPNAIQPIPLSQLPPKPNNELYATGDMLQSMLGPVKIVGISGDNAIIDFNHFLAGEDLIFEVTVKDIK